MNQIEACDIMRLKRERFSVSIRKQKLEETFKQKRLKCLQDQQHMNRIPTLYDFPSQEIQNILRLDAYLLQSLTQVKFYMGNLDNQETIFQKLDEILILVPVLLDILKNKQIIQAPNPEVPLKAQELLIDITYFSNKSQILNIINLPNFTNVFNTLQCSHDTLQRDFTCLIKNILSELTEIERQQFEKQFKILQMLRDSSITWGGSDQYHKKCFKLMVVICRTRGIVLQEDDIQETIELIQTALINSKQSYKLENSAYHLLLLLIPLHSKLDDLVRMEFGSILINYIQALDDSFNRQVSLAYVLQIICTLIDYGDIWTQQLIEEGLPSGLCNVLQSRLCNQLSTFQLVVQITTYIFEIEDQRSYMVMQNKQDLVELILTNIAEFFKYDKEVPNYTVRLLVNLVNRPKFLDIVVNTIDFFNIMCSEIQRLDCAVNQYFDLDDWLTAVTKVFDYGDETKDSEMFVGQFINRNGTQILEYLQKSVDNNVVTLCQNLMNYLE